MIWTQVDDSELVKLRHGGETWETIAGFFHTTVESARSRYRRLGQVSTAKDYGRLLKLEQEKQRDAALRHQDAEQIKRLAKDFNLLSELRELVTETVPAFPVPQPYIQPAHRDGKVVEESLLFMLSDWHGYEIVLPERVRGLNEYNAKVFGQRVWALMSAAISIKHKLEAASWHFPRGVFSLNGDFVSGTIHELERHTDAPNIVMTVYGTAYVLANFLKDLAPEFEQMDVFCTSGNHGRLPDARKMQQKDPTRNWDTVIYLMAKQMLVGYPNITFYIPDSYSAAFDVEGWNFLQTHGHDIQMWNQIPWYGMKRQISSVSALEAGRGQTIDYFLWGHFHSKTAFATATGESFINGSLIGGTEYTLNRLGLVDKPSQWLLGIHPEHGVSHRWAINCEADEDAPGYVTKPWEEERAE